eukprot:m.266140 g.266140  ORF g.266140 m.266140 type:complete len:954 (-) comp15627_c0_seq52:1144-4005(-)
MKNEATACRDEAPLVISALAAPTKRRRRQRTTKLVASKRTFVFRLERLCIQLLCFGDSKGSAHQQMSMSQATPSARPLATRQSTSSGRGDAKGFRSARDWTAEEVAVWIRGVEKVDRDVLEGFIEEGIDGTKLCELGKEDLGDFGIKQIGKQISIMAAIHTLFDMEAYLVAEPVSLLGSQLLQAGRLIEANPLQAVCSMISSLTHTLQRLDTSSTFTGKNNAVYLEIRTTILQECSNFISAISASDNPSASNSEFVKQAKDFIRQILPCLQKLRAIVSQHKRERGDMAGKDAPDQFLHSVTAIAATGSTLGVVIRCNGTNFPYIAAIEPNSPADRSGLLRVGDEIIFISSQNVVGWRARSAMTLLAQCQGKIQLTIKLSGEEYDYRINRVMEQARALRNSMSSTGRRSRTSNGHDVPSGSISARSSFSTGSDVHASSAPAADTSERAIVVRAPTSGSQWHRGGTYSIEWKTKDISASRTLVIRLISKIKCYNITLADVVINTGDYSWTIPEDLPLADDFRILVSITAGKGVEYRAFSQQFAVVPSAAPAFPQVPPQLSQKLKARRVHLTQQHQIVPGHWGFDLDGCFVSDIVAEAFVATTGALHVGDQIIEINGVPTHDASVMKMTVLTQQAQELELIVVSNVTGYHQFVASFNDLYDEYRSKLSCRHITLKPTANAEFFGLNLHAVHNSMVVQSVAPNTPADKDRHLTNHASIIQINDVPTAAASVLETLEFMDIHKSQPLSLIVTPDTEAYTKYINLMLTYRTRVLLTPEQCAEAKRNMSRKLMPSLTRLAPRSRANSSGSESSRQSIKDVLVRKLSFNKRGSASSHEQMLEEAGGNIPCQNLHQPDCDGYLIKQGGSGITPKNWRKRWFVLKDGTVYYYKTPYDDAALGYFTLHGYMIMPPQPGKRMHNKFGFKIFRDGYRTFYLCAESAEDMKRWMNALSLASIQYQDH